MCVLSEKCFVVIYVFSFPTGVYVGTLNLIASIPGPSILTSLKLYMYFLLIAFNIGIKHDFQQCINSTCAHELPY